MTRAVGSSKCRPSSRVARRAQEQVLFRTRMGADLTRATRERGGLPEGQGVGAGSGAWRAEEEANGDVSQAY